MNYESDREIRRQTVGDDDDGTLRDDSSTVDDGESHATTGGAAAAGAVTGGVIGLTGGPVGAAIGAVGGAIVGAAAERMMHSHEDGEQVRPDVHDDEVHVTEHRERDTPSESASESASTIVARPTGTAEPLNKSISPKDAYEENTPVDRPPVDRPLTEVEEPVGEPLAALPDRETRPLI